jgi:hypothetical protein
MEVKWYQIVSEKGNLLSLKKSESNFRGTTIRELHFLLKNLAHEPCFSAPFFEFR